ncbi:tRNA (adenine(22)-N(1))-methyltransferase TrmK [Colwellia sp. MB3u-70]|uniref:tRNA (adenine(22)-N(1))-methyltransferase n=1 Tax=unclassified Colwellia TaxID=196834 RepID=UPI0015F40597|nr:MULTISPECIES: tRNA (adenine(22)-N(1))-methyltransferase TrmK [unclassified Colwellia]MBA6293284.1 tRNA (adenine(22)-N(1))-methyltransferase TrmK [Colwellia sp. MB3u-8]MBA6307846.1 tRNA (adenine(22)-N(1))-methyltransferase TrmK [Colwellia sp. MB3u-70]
MKLSKRLQHIEQMVTADYTHIWDCCCDHGFLGASLLSRQAAQNIHFVDIVPELITVIESKLQEFFQHSISAWKTHCLDVAKLPLQEYPGKHLVIIAGIGANLMSQFINDIHQKYPDMNIDFLLCPVNQQFALREKLIALKFSLKNEVLVKDNCRYYEVILVSSTSDTQKEISPVGHNIWQSATAEQASVVKQYLDKTLKHYRRVQQGSTVNIGHIISAYNSKT